MLINEFVAVFYGYLLMGAVFGFYFVGWGAARIDSAAQHMSVVLRLLLWPASMALWPFLLWKVWLRRSG